MERVCPDCGVPEGQLHKYGCALEICPVCAKQLIGCSDCAESIFGQRSEDELANLWSRYIDGLGRLPFMVPSPIKHWEAEGLSPKEELLEILLGSLNEIPRLLPNPDIKEYPSQPVAEFGSFKVRYYGAFEGRDPSTGEPATSLARLIPSFQASKAIREIFLSRAVDWTLKYLDSPSSLWRCFDCALDYAYRTNARRIEIQEIGILEISFQTDEDNVPSQCNMRIVFFETFITELEQNGLLLISN